MEVQEEATGSKEYLQIMKGKRTKRPRQACSLALTMASSSSSVAAEEGGGVSENSGGFDDRATTTTASPTNSGEFTGGGGGGEEEDDNDMANCLILLAQGLRPPIVPSNCKAGSYVYQCKTCDRCFPSFQALGGHRASHKKPKAAGGGGEFEKKKLLPLVLIHENEGGAGGGDQSDRVRTALSLQIPNRVSAGNSNNKSRVHECSVCGAEFSSGQALGGHMRRHRAISVATTTTGPGDHSRGEGKKSSRNNILALDLNLPAAPEDDDHRRESKFQQVIVFSAAPSLVDCHY